MAKEFVQFYTFNSCERNDYDNVFKWVKYRLERADRPTPILNDIQVRLVQLSFPKSYIYALIYDKF